MQVFFEKSFGEFQLFFDYQYSVFKPSNAIYTHTSPGVSYFSEKSSSRNNFTIDILCFCHFLWGLYTKKP